MKPLPSNLQQLKTFSGLFATRVEFGVPPVVPLSFHWPLFRSMAKQDIPGGTNKSLRTQLLWQLSLLRSCAWRRLLYPSGEGVGVTRSEEQSPTWDFSQPQLEHGTGEGWKPSLPSHPFPFSLTENREGCLHVLPLTVNKPKAPC